MGIRIHKDIGYILEKDNVSAIVRSDFSNILEELDYETTQKENFFNKIEENMLNYNGVKNNSENIILKVMGKSFKESCKENNIEPYNLVSHFYMYDDDMGILFRSIELYKACRFDDLIDYYEIDTAAHHIKYLNTPIYPTSGYIYKGGLEKDFPNLVVGQVYDSFEIKNLYLANYDAPQDDKILSSGFFTINIEAFAYIAAKASGILLPGVTEHDFNCLVKPIIATYWA